MNGSDGAGACICEGRRRKETYVDTHRTKERDIDAHGGESRRHRRAQDD